MKTAPGPLIYESAHWGNILPVTSVCNVSCVFCSHRQNPPGIEVYKIPHLTPAQVAESLHFISSQDKIVIGESVTRIIEGEPFTNPYIKEILSLVRHRFPTTTIQITSNGTLIDGEMTSFLADLGQVEINLSLNSASFLTRQWLMRDPVARSAVAAAARLARAGIDYHGSVVAMPHVTGWDDLRHTITYLADSNAITIRVFLPGFTWLAPEQLKFAPGLWDELWAFTEDIGNQLPVPITTEPPVIKDLTPSVRGVVRDSPAAAAGLQKGDVINSVDGQTCVSRVDAFFRVKSAGRPDLDVSRGDIRLSLQIDKSPDQSSGLVMDHDITPWVAARISQVAGKYRRIKLLCSEMGAPALRMALRKLLAERGPALEIIPVKNRYFGGSIMSAGLLLVPDFLAAIAEKAANLKSRTVTRQSTQEAVVVPATAFDREGRDLAGNSYLAIEEETGCKVEII